MLKFSLGVEWANLIRTLIPRVWLVYRPSHRPLYPNHHSWNKVRLFFGLITNSRKFSQPLPLTLVHSSQPEIVM